MNEPLDQDALEHGSMMPEQPKAVRSSDLLGIRFTFKDACEIVYGKNCKHEWFEGRCVHCEVTPDWARAVMDANARIGVEHNRVVDAERKNANLIAEVGRMRAMMPNEKGQR